MPGLIAGAIAGGSALSAGSSLLGSGKAQKGATDAANLQQQRYEQTAGTLQPFVSTGQAALPNLLSLAQSGPTGGGPDYLSQAAGMVPPQMTEAQLVQTPGYQFNLSQGLKAVQSSAAARGLGVSGQAMKGAATYATGHADNTNQNQFNNAQQRFSDVFNLNTGQQTNLQNQFSRMQNTASLGENAGAQTGTIGASLAQTQGNLLNQAGLAGAAGATGVGSAVTGGINSYLGYNALQSYLNPSGSTSNYTPATPSNPTAYTTGGFYDPANAPITG
jgi:hypothetical protein